MLFVHGTEYSVHAAASCSVAHGCWIQSVVIKSRVLRSYCRISPFDSQGLVSARYQYGVIASYLVVGFPDPPSIDPDIWSRVGIVVKQTRASDCSSLSASDLQAGPLRLMTDGIVIVLVTSSPSDTATKTSL